MTTKITAQRLAALERRLKAYRPFIRGSAVVTRKPCIREGCPACREGRKHPSSMLTVSVQGKAKTRYLPQGLIAQARRQTENYRKSRVIWERMSEIWIEELLRRTGK